MYEEGEFIDEYGDEYEGGGGYIDEQDMFDAFMGSDDDDDGGSEDGSEYSEGEDGEEGRGGEQQQFQPGIQAHTMAGGSILMPTGKNLRPEERFMIQVEAIGRDLKDKGYIGSDGAIEKMINKLNKVKNIKYKNPTGYVLGYIGSAGGTKITKDTMKQAFRASEIVKEISIFPPDAVRYAKYWMTLNKL